MATKIERAPDSVIARTPATEPPEAQSKPRWMTWAPVAAIAWALVCGSVRIWWAISDAPSSSPLRNDLVVFSGWRAVGLCIAVAAVTLALRMEPRRWPLMVAAWGLSAALLAASALLLLDVIGGLFPGIGVQFHPVVFMSRAATLGGAVLVGAAAEAYRRVLPLVADHGPGGPPERDENRVWWRAGDVVPHWCLEPDS